MKNYLNLEKSKTIPFLRDVCIDEIYKYAKKNKDIYFATPDMGAPSLDKYRKEIPKQFIHMGICEQHMIAMAAGLAMMKKKVFCYAMAPFITSRCYEQIKCSVAAMDQPVTLIGIGVGLGYADAGPTHYSTEDIATMRVFPNVEILTPSDRFSTIEMVKLCLKRPKFRFLRIDRDVLPDIYNKNNFNLDKGWSEIIKGSKNCVVSSGYLLHKCLDQIKNKKKEIGLIDVFRINNQNRSLITKLKKYNKIIIIEEQWKSGGLGSYLLELSNNYKVNLNLEIKSLNKKYFFENGGRDHLHKHNGLDIQKIISNI